MIPVFHFNIKKCTGRTGNKSLRIIEIRIPLKYLSNFWRSLGMSLIDCALILF